MKVNVNDSSLCELNFVSPTPNQKKNQVLIATTSDDLTYK